MIVISSLKIWGVRYMIELMTKIQRRPIFPLTGVAIMFRVPLGIIWHVHFHSERSLSVCLSLGGVLK